MSPLTFDLRGHRRHGRADTADAISHCFLPTRDFFRSFRGPPVEIADAISGDIFMTKSIRKPVAVALRRCAMLS